MRNKYYFLLYVDQRLKGRRGVILVLQPTDARLAFPCWDEPAVKATFDITLVVPKDRVALSNMVRASHTFV